MEQERGMKGGVVADDPRQREAGGGFLAGVVVGAVIGATVALLLAPDTGRVTRRRLRGRLRRLRSRGERGLDELESRTRRLRRRRV